MVRDVYPHDRPEAPYERTANDVITKGNADSAKKAMLSEGIENLKKAEYGNLNFKKSTKYLKKLKSLIFFSM